MPVCMNVPVSMADSPKTDPTERSNSPLTITFVIPTDIIPRRETCRKILSQFFEVMKTSDVKPKKIMSAARAMITPISFLNIIPLFVDKVISSP
jgi:hypothetical protein